jgi:hypothetical protein
MINYTWEIEVTDTIPYNINSGQANIIKQATFTLKGVDSEFSNKMSEVAGSVVWNHTNGVAEGFVDITEVTTATVQGWVEDRLGADTIAQFKAEIEQAINSQPDDHVMIPEE